MNKLLLSGCVATLSPAGHLSSCEAALSREAHLSGCKGRTHRFAPTACLLLLCSLTLAAQNGITISDFSTKAGSPTTVTFNVQWVPLQGKVWSDTAGVFVDYNNAGTMTWLPLSGATLTNPSWSSASVIFGKDGNNNGAWVVGNARDEGSLSTCGTSYGDALMYGSEPLGVYCRARFDADQVRCVK